MRHAFLDMDGVVVDLMPNLSRAHGRIYSPETHPQEYDLEKVFGKSQHEIWNHPEVLGAEFWASLPKLPWADDVVNLLRREFGDGRVSFLSQCVRDPACASGKAQWIREHYPRIPYLLGTEKTLVAAPGFVLVDDYEKNEATWRKAGGTVILFPAPWNRFRGHPDPVGLVERELRERRREMEMI